MMRGADRHGSVEPPSWDSRGGGWFRHTLRRVFGDGENPLTWAVPLYSAWGIRVRLHVVFILMVVGQIVHSLWLDIGPLYTATGLGCLFLLVLLHEYGHCFTARRIGGDADEIVMWPLGGLAMCQVPDDWRAHLWTALGGPLVNVVLLPVLATAVYLATGEWSAVFFNPFRPELALGGFSASNSLVLWLVVAAWWLHYMNVVLLAFNLLVPMFPMDGGRILQASLWARSGYAASMRTACVVGLVAAVALFVVAAIGRETVLMAIALFGGLVCWFERRRLALVAGEESEFASSLRDEPPEEPSRADERRRQREAEEQAEVDRILAKISEQGMDSLTRAERKALQRATERKRTGG
ncbi:MAG: hypothetical protein DYG93_11330 [Leptolyngbya sp. PLA2]|nr:hypothetical protein [Leptolyngbya sp.]MCE7972236.1 hypothetical protein [Leptolyngbya sp. PL-A2]MCQ3941184.1 hypothetical protein [cyanobacterium CYA1]MCZ7633253.1 hypothetical protein [Phycisphaerales bacterium]MDL1905468.1 hypothetical protein [Synechococcales cyanobacterium CNB]GIK18271.1 MAG: hypothetical protein BroJett004_04350 [Planctomycetota bacterium]